jgi:hypothetical protein
VSLYDRTSDQHLDYLEQHKAALARQRYCVHDEPVPGKCADCRREHDEATR